jgi:tetratricopeptide (TPR) repeat protein
LVLLVILAAILLVRYVDALIDRDFRELALTAGNPERRKGKIVQLDSFLDRFSPPAESFRPAVGPLPPLVKAMPPLFCLLGVATLIGGFSAGLDQPWRPEIGFALFLLAALVSLLTLRRRRWERGARLFRFRADLRRLDGNRRGAADDLLQSLRLAPWDDASWGELADDLAAAGESDQALAAIRQARELDPDYDDHRQAEVSLLLRLNRFAEARKALQNWREIADDPRIVIFQAGLELAEGKREQAARMPGGLRVDAPAIDLAANDPALAGLKSLLPGGVESKP